MSLWNHFYLFAFYLGRVDLISNAWARRYNSAIYCSKMPKFAAAKSWIVPSCSCIAE